MDSPPKLPPLYTAPEAARRLGVHPGTIRRWANRLALGGRLGTQIVLTAPDLEKIDEAAYRKPGNPSFSR